MSKNDNITNNWFKRGIWFMKNKQYLVSSFAVLISVLIIGKFNFFY